MLDDFLELIVSFEGFLSNLTKSEHGVGNDQMSLSNLSCWKNDSYHWSVIS